MIGGGGGEGVVRGGGARGCEALDCPHEASACEGQELGSPPRFHCPCSCHKTYIVIVLSHDTHGKFSL